MKATIGRIVLYRSRTGDYTVPAIVNCTMESLNPKGVEAGHVPDLTDEDHVHLTCFTPGKPGLRTEALDFKVESEHGRSENVAGCYQEWDIPHDVQDPATTGLDTEDGGTIPDHPPGTWRWVPRVIAS